MRPHVHAAWSTRSLLRLFILASLPTALVGTWNLGRQTLLALEAGAVTDVPDWLTALATYWSGDVAGLSTGIALLAGLGFVLPLLVVVLGTSAVWAHVFARVRQRDVDPGWLPVAWLLVWLLPPDTTPGVAALAASFGSIVGMHIFGGTGRFLVSPVLLGVLFVHFSYPEFGVSALPVASTTGPDWDAVVGGGADAVSWTGAFLGAVPGGIGTGSALACLLGALFLVIRRVAAWQVLAGAMAGLLLTWWLLALLTDGPVAGLEAFWHPVLGNLAFVLAFVATDPSPAPLLRVSRWIYGGLFGVLTVLIRTLDPAHPEGSLFALLLATLAVPLVDHLALSRYRLRESAP